MDALDSTENLTEIGLHICDFPIPPHYAKMVLVSVALKCLDPILTIACILAYAQPFSSPSNASDRRELHSIIRKLTSDTYSDHMALLRAFQFWQKARSEGREKNFCQKNFISAAAFEVISIIRTQLLGQLRASGFVKARGSGDIRDLNTNSENWAVVKAAIVAGMSPNLLQFNSADGSMRMSNEPSVVVHVHPLSTLSINCVSPLTNQATYPSKWIVCDNVIRPTDSNIIREELQPILSNETKPVFTTRSVMNDRSESVKDFGLASCLTVVTPITVALMTSQRQSDQEYQRLGPDSTFATNQRSHDTSRSSTPDCIWNAFDSSGSSECSSDTECFGAQSDWDSTEPLCAKEYSSENYVINNRDNHNAFNTRAFNYSSTRLYDGLGQQNGVESHTLSQASNYQALGPVVSLRLKWHALLLRRLKSPSKQYSQTDEAILSAVVNVLSAEEQNHGFRQPSGVGSRPRPMAVELCNQPDQTTNNSVQPTSHLPRRAWASTMHRLEPDHSLSNTMQQSINEQSSLQYLPCTSARHSQELDARYKAHGFRIVSYPNSQNQVRYTEHDSLGMRPNENETRCWSQKSTQRDDILINASQNPLLGGYSTNFTGHNMDLGSYMSQTR